MVTAPRAHAGETITIKPGTNSITLRRVRLRLAMDAASAVIHGAVWKGAGLTVLVSDDPTDHGTLRHISISHKHRYPTWEEIKAVREVFIPPDVDAMMMLPVEADFVNIHARTFHIWQTPAAWGVQ